MLGNSLADLVIEADHFSVVPIQRLAILAGPYTCKGELMSKSTLTVYLPDRPLPLCVEADTFKYFGCELALEKDGEIVARSSDRGFVVQSDLLREPTLGYGVQPIDRVESCVALPAPARLAEFKTNPAPAWPFSVGMAVGVLSSGCVAVALLIGA